MLINRISAISGKSRQRFIPAKQADMEMWELGYGGIEEMMPYLQDKDRDFILAGISDDEWKEAFRELK